MKSRNLSIILMLLATSTWAKAEDTSYIRKALVQIRKAEEKGTVLPYNPLKDLPFSAYASRGYLYTYRALVNMDLAEKAGTDTKQSLLDWVLLDLERAKLSPDYPVDKVQAIYDRYVKHSIEFYFQQKAYYQLMHQIDLLPVEEKTKAVYILHYAYALFRTGQHEDFKHLARKYQTLLMDKTLVEKHLKVNPQWEKLLSSISDKDFRVVSASKSKFSTMLPSKQEVLENPALFLKKLDRDLYLKDSKSLFDFLSGIYFNLRLQKEASSEERGFVRAFEKSAYSFSPDLLDALIYKYWRNLDYKKAQEYAERFLKNFEGHSAYPRMLYDLARIQEDAQDYKSAFKTFQRVVAITDQENFYEFAYFRQAWVLYLSGKKKEAASYFQKYVETFPNGAYASASDYFFLKSSEYNVTQDLEKATLRNFVSKYNLNFYTFLLIDEYRLEEDMVFRMFSEDVDFKAFEAQIQKFETDLESLRLLKLHKELVDFSLTEDAVRVFGLFKSRLDSDMFTFYLASQAQKLGDAAGQLNAVTKLYGNYPEHRKKIPWKSLYPNFEYERIKKVLSEMGSTLSPYLIMSLIRQESAFDPFAKSPANAQGLMQLIPSTALMSAKKIGLQNFIITKVEDNLRIGMKTFHDLMQRYENRIDYALSGYNAGEAVTDRWIQARGHLSPLEFIESIPYNETRLYVKNILRNYAVYRVLYEKRPEALIAYNATKS